MQIVSGYLVCAEVNRMEKHKLHMSIDEQIDNLKELGFAIDNEGEVCPEHIHMLVNIPPKMSVSGLMGYLKGKSSFMIFQSGEI